MIHNKMSSWFFYSNFIDNQRTHTESVTAKCYLFSIYFVLQTKAKLFTLLFSSFPKHFHYMYAVILTTFNDVLSEGAGLTGV